MWVASGFCKMIIRVILVIAIVILLLFWLEVPEDDLADSISTETFAPQESVIKHTKENE